MRNRTLVVVGAALLVLALVLGTFSMVLAPAQAQWSPGGWGPGGMMGGYGPMMGPHGMPEGYGTPVAPTYGSARGAAVALGWLALLTALIVGVALLVRWLTSANGDSGGAAGDSALEILKRRYIAGEIDEAEYEEGVKRTLA
jgi:uncharacterized membrane protein